MIMGFTTFANKIEVKSSSNTAATFKGSVEQDSLT